MKDSQRKAMFAKSIHSKIGIKSIMPDSEKYYKESRDKDRKIVNNYNEAHDVIVKLTKKKYSSISHGEYVRKVRHYHATILKYKKRFDIEPNNVIRMS